MRAGVAWDRKHEPERTVAGFRQGRSGPASSWQDPGFRREIGGNLGVKRARKPNFLPVVERQGGDKKAEDVLTMLRRVAIAQ